MQQIKAKRKEKNIVQDKDFNTLTTQSEKVNEYLDIPES